MSFDTENLKCSTKNTRTTLGELLRGSLFIFEDEGLHWDNVLIKLDEVDKDGDPQYAWLCDGIMGSRSGEREVIKVKVGVTSLEVLE